MAGKRSDRRRTPITFTMPAELVDWVVDYADETEQTMSAVGELAVREFMERRKGGPIHPSVLKWITIAYGSFERTRWLHAAPRMHTNEEWTAMCEQYCRDKGFPVPDDLAERIERIMEPIDALPVSKNDDSDAPAPEGIQKPAG